VTGAQIESFVTLIAASAVVIILVFVGVPRLARLLFRHRMESIRDDGVNEILDGRLRREPPVDMFLETVDHAAEHARWVTFARSAAILLALKDLGVEDPSEVARAPSYCELESGERKIMHDLEERTYAAFRSYMIWGSPLGWAIAPVALIASRLHPESKLAKTEDALPALARDAMSGDQGSHPKTARWAAGSGHRYAER